MRELELGDHRAEGEGFVAAEIPDVGGELSMLVIVPDEGRFNEVRDDLGQDLHAFAGAHPVRRLGFVVGQQLQRQECSLPGVAQG